MALFGCILVFMHLLVMSVAEKGKSVNKKGVFTYFCMYTEGNHLILKQMNCIQWKIRAM